MFVAISSRTSSRSFLLVHHHHQAAARPALAPALALAHTARMSSSSSSGGATNARPSDTTLRPSTEREGQPSTAKPSVPSTSNSAPAGQPIKTSTPTVITSYPPHLVTFSRPFSRFGIIPVGGRSTAIQLQSPPNAGSLWVLASTPLDEPTKAKIQEMGGEVKYLVAADNVHHLFVKEWLDAYPGAKAIGVEGLDEKRKDIKWAGLYGKDEQKFGFEEEIEARYFPTFANKDVAFHHKSSSTLIVADILFNLPATEQFLNTKSGKPSSPIPFLASFAKLLQPHRSLHANFLWLAGSASGEGSAAERRKQFACDAEVVAGWRAKRIVPCHGDVINEGGHEIFLSAFKKYLTPDGQSRFKSS